MHFHTNTSRLQFHSILLGASDIDTERDEIMEPLVTYVLQKNSVILLISPSTRQSLYTLLNKLVPQTFLSCFFA